MGPPVVPGAPAVGSVVFSLFLDFLLFSGVYSFCKLLCCCFLLLGGVCKWLMILTVIVRNPLTV